ncbi:hypothetical protein [Streptomyces sp. CA-106110]|uniref:hypothetical protein n=1 Tax=Streptomyces sp. CA-106110 TaxID=3240044 RepID=UPI003D922DD2
MNHLRRLPFNGPEGKPAFVPANNPDGALSRFADAIEAHQLAVGQTILALVRPMLDVALTADEARYMLRRTAECLSDALGVAESRGQRLGLSDEPISGAVAEVLSKALKQGMSDAQ